jgi:hypothetical protein
VRGRPASLLAILGSVLFLLARAEATAGPERAQMTVDGEHVWVSGEGNQLVALRRAPVAYATIERLLADIERPLPPNVSAMRLVRISPPETIDYVLCVTREGDLIVAEQVRTPGAGTEGPRFRRGEIRRVYTPLETPEMLTWAITVPLGRETDVVFEVRATTARWPLTTVTMTPSPLR